MSNVVELSPDIDQRINTFTNRLDDLLIEFLADNNLTIATGLGILEAVKLDIYLRIRETL